MSHLNALSMPEQILLYHEAICSEQKIWLRQPESSGVREYDKNCQERAPYMA